MIYKYCVRNVARRHKQTATFMPKPLFGDNGSGMHSHFSLWQGRRSALRRRRLCRALATWPCTRSAASCKHAPALLALTNPTTNSYKRLVPGYEAPVNLVYSQRNRSAACRIPMYSQSPKAKRIEFRCPDPTCNPYLAFAAMHDGRDRRHSEQDSRPASRSIRTFIDLAAGRTGRDSQDARDRWTRRSRPCESDCDFLLKGDVFTPDVIDTWIATSGSTKSMRCACGRIRTSFACTTTRRRPPRYSRLFRTRACRQSTIVSRPGPSEQTVVAVAPVERVVAQEADQHSRGPLRRGANRCRATVERVVACTTMDGCCDVAILLTT